MTQFLEYWFLIFIPQETSYLKILINNKTMLLGAPMNRTGRKGKLIFNINTSSGIMALSQVQ
jgi:hypothetical protein